MPASLQLCAPGAGVTVLSPRCSDLLRAARAHLQFSMDGDVESGAQASPARDPEKQVRCDVRQLPSALARVSASAADKADVMPMPARPTADAPRRGRQALERAARRLRRSHPRVVLPRSELGPGAHCAPRCLACATPLPCIARRGLTPSGDPARSLAQELQCGLGLWGSVGLSLGCMQPLLSACVFQLGFANGGPRTVIYGFILCFLLCLPLALSMAEIASVNINAGGIYYFAGAMSGRLGKVPAFVSGWVYTIAAVSGTAAISLQAVSIRMIYSYGFESSAGAPSSTQQLQFCFAVALLHQRCVCFGNGAQPCVALLRTCLSPAVASSLAAAACASAQHPNAQVAAAVRWCCPA